MKKYIYILSFVGLLIFITGIILFKKSYWPGHEIISDGNSTTCIDGIPYFYPEKLFLAVLLMTIGSPLTFLPIILLLMNRKNYNKVSSTDG